MNLKSQSAINIILLLLCDLLLMIVTVNSLTAESYIKHKAQSYVLCSIVCVCVAGQLDLVSEF